MSNLSFAQSGSSLVSAINSQLIPLQTLSPDTDFSDLQKLKTILKDKSIVGMGEATHGTHEFFVFKHRMLEFLVKEMGFKTFVIEGDFAGTQALNNYVLYGKGNPNEAIRRVAGPWLKQEFLDMVKWVRAYNDTRPLTDRISFYGCDMQFGSFAADSLKSYLTQNGQLTPEISAGFTELDKFLPTLTGKEKAIITTAVSALTQIQFKGTDTNRVAMYQRDVRELQQFLENLNAKSTVDENNVRDKYMAENVTWIYNHTNHNKMMIWAHNGHVGKSSGGQNLRRMGMFLAQTFKGQYYAFGLDFSNVTVSRYDGKTQKPVISTIPYSKAGSSGAWFAQCNAPYFMLDLKSASINPDINKFLNTELFSIFLGAGALNGKSLFYIKHKLIDTYDGVIFIRETTPAIAMDK